MTAFTSYFFDKTAELISDIRHDHISDILQTNSVFMIGILFVHQWKSFWRSRNAGKSLAIQIIIGFITIYLLAVAISVGFMLPQLLKHFFPSQNMVQVFCGFLLYYFLFDLLFRFMMQDLPTLTIQPYLLQNIQRSQLIRFLNVRSMFTAINFVPLFLFIPFTVKSIAPVYGGLTAFVFTISIIALTLFNHFTILYVKRKSIVNSWWYVIFFAAIGVFSAADYWGLFSLRKLSVTAFTALLRQPSLAALPVLFAVAAFINNYRFLLKNLYLEDIVAKGRKKQGADYAFLNRFGAVGELVALDIKLILRNKRPRSMAMMSGLLMFYGFFFYKPEYLAQGKLFVLLFGALFITGLFIMTYGQFLFAWQSAHFDGMMAGNLSVKMYIKSKFVLFTGVSTVLLLLGSLYGIIGWQVLLVQLAAYLYNIGIQTVIAVYFATRSYKAINIGRAATFNYEGMGAEKWVYSLVIYLVPILIYLPFGLLISPWAGIIAIGSFGITSFLLQDWWVELLTKEFFKRKYKILTGFREK